MTMIFYWLPGALLFAADRLAKGWAQRILAGEGAVDAVPGLFRLRYAQNTGAAFSMFSGGGALLIAAGALLVALVTVFAFREKNKLAKFALSLVALGGLSNLLDRLLYGYVVDYVDLLFMRFAVFNVADVMVTVGAALFAISLLFGRKGDEKRDVDG